MFDLLDIMIKKLCQPLIWGSQSLNTTIGLLKGRKLIFTPKLITFYAWHPFLFIQGGVEKA